MTQKRSVSCCEAHLNVESKVVYLKVGWLFFCLLCGFFQYEYLAEGGRREGLRAKTSGNVRWTSVKSTAKIKIQLNPTSPDCVL